MSILKCEVINFILLANDLEKFHCGCEILSDEIIKKLMEEFNIKFDEIIE